MPGFFESLANALAPPVIAAVKPPLVEAVQKLVGMATKAVETAVGSLIEQASISVQDEIKKQIPLIVKSVVGAVLAASTNVAEDVTNKITDAIPGQWDDNFADTMLAEIRKGLGIK